MPLRSIARQEQRGIFVPQIVACTDPHSSSPMLCNPLSCAPDSLDPLPPLPFQRVWSRPFPPMPLCGIVPFLLILGVCCAAATALLFVTPTGSDSVGCGAPNAPCASLAAAVARANSLPDDDVMIQLAAGAYGPSSCNATAMRSMRIVGSGSAVTVIDCAFTSRLLYVPHDSNITVMGISVRRGFASAASPGGLFGGCVFVDWLAPINATVAPSAVFIDVNFSNCKVDTSSDAYWGGGGGLAVIFANDIWNTNQSGTFLSSSILIRNCTFSHNYVRQGTAWTVVGGGAMVGANSGGVVVDLALTISDTEFTNNQLTSALYSKSSCACSRLARVCAHVRCGAVNGCVNGCSPSLPHSGGRWFGYCP